MVTKTCQLTVILLLLQSSKTYAYGKEEQYHLLEHFSGSGVRIADGGFRVRVLYPQVVTKTHAHKKFGGVFYCACVIKLAAKKNRGKERQSVVGRSHIARRMMMEGKSYSLRRRQALRQTSLHQSLPCRRRGTARKRPENIGEADVTSTPKRTRRTGQFGNDLASERDCQN